MNRVIEERSQVCAVEKRRNSARSRIGRVALAGALAFAALLAAGCDENEILETLELEARDDGAWTLTLNVDFAAPEEPDGELQNRIDEYTRALLEDRHDWSHRFGQLSAARESVTWERRYGNVVAFRRSAEAQSENLPLFFGDLPLTIVENSGPGWRELTLVAAGSRRASRQQTRRLGDAFDEWSEALEEYVGATRDLYMYLDRKPARAEATLGTVFSDLLDVETRARLGELSEEEAALTGRVRAALDRALVLFDAESSRAASLDELSRLVYDPLPAEFRVRLRYEVIESTGFVRRDDGVWAVQRRSLSDALLSLEKRWVEPELLTTWLDATEDAKPLDLAALAAARRRAQAGVEASVIREAIEEQLRPPATFRIRWAI
jgi:hypothetical protein